MTRSAFITCIGGWGKSYPERLLETANLAIALENIYKAKQGNQFDVYIVITDVPNKIGLCSDYFLVERSSTPFHFGNSILSVIRKHSIDSVCYVGGGALPLAPVSLILRALNSEGHQAWIISLSSSFSPHV